MVQHQNEIATAAVVWHELLVGCQRLPTSRKCDKIEDYWRELQASNWPILAYTKISAE